MQSFLVNLLICTISMSVIALLFTAVMPLLAKRYSEKGQYYTWLIVLIGFIIPFRPKWGNALINVEVPSGILPSGMLPSDALIPGASSPTGTLPLFDSFGNAVPYDTALSVSLWQIGFYVWLTGLAVFLVYHGIKHYRFAKMTKRWSINITDGHILSLLQTLKSEIGIKQQIPVYLCAFAGSPMMTGLIKPRILLPKANLTRDEFFFIFKHELMHYKRKDLLYKYLVLAVTAMHWFNPVAYLMAKNVHNLCETSCDAEILKNEGMEMRQSYSEVIVGMMHNQSNLKTALSACFYRGKRDFKKRILSIMDMRRKKMGSVVFCAILAFILGTGCIITASQADEGNPPDIAQADAEDLQGMVQVQDGQPDADPQPSQPLAPDDENLLREEPDSTVTDEDDAEYIYLYEYSEPVLEAMEMNAGNYRITLKLIDGEKHVSITLSDPSEIKATGTTTSSATVSQTVIKTGIRVSGDIIYLQPGES